MFGCGYTKTSMNTIFSRIMVTTVLTSLKKSSFRFHEKFCLNHDLFCDVFTKIDFERFKMSLRYLLIVPWF